MRVIQASTQIMPQNIGKTDEKIISQKIRLLEERFTGVFENVNDCIVYLDLTGRILDINKRGLELFGGAKKDFIGRRFVEFLESSTRDKSTVVNFLRKILVDVKLKFTTTLKNKKSQEIEVEISASLEKSNGKAFGILVIVRDVTEQKKAKEIAEDALKKYTLLFENAQDVIVVFDLKGNIITSNKAIEEYGLKRGEVAGENMLRFVHKSQWQKVLNDLPRLSQGIPTRGELKINTPKGEIIAEYKSNSIKIGEKVVGFQTILRDITERIKVEEKLAESEEQYRVLFEQSPIGIIIATPKGKITNVNKAMEVITGYSQKELQSLIFFDICEEPEIKKIILETLNRQGIINRFQTRIRRKDGAVIKVLLNASKIYVRGDDFIQIRLQDLSELGFAEERLRDSEEKYRNLFENARDLIVTFDMKGKITSVNKTIQNYGFRKEEIIGKNFLKFISKSNLYKVLKDFVKASRGEPVEGQVELITPRGKIVTEYRTNPITSGDKIVGTQATLRNITERRMMEDDLRASEEKFRGLFEEAMDAIFVADAETGILMDCNRAACELVGKEKSELIGKHQRILHPPQEINGEFSRTFIQHLKEKEGQILETKVITKDGKLKDVAIKARVFELEGKKVMQGIFRDVTEHKQTEETLRNSEEKYRILVETAPVGIIGTDMKGVITSCNSVVLKTEGYSRDEIVGKHFTKLGFLRARDIPRLLKTYYSAVMGKEIRPFVVESFSKDGTSHLIEVHTSPLKKDNKIVGFQIATIDITERKEMEEKLASERDLLEALMDNIPDLIYFKDVDSRFTRINRAEASVLGLKDAEKAVGKTDFDFFTPEHAHDAFNDEQKIVKTGQPLIAKAEKIRRADGQFRWVTATKVPIKDLTGKVTGLVGISRDITENKQIEEKMEYQKSLFDALMDNMPDAIYFKDSESRFIRVSRVSCPGLGIKDPEEAIGMTDFDFAPKELAEQFYADDQMIMKTGKPVIGKEEMMVNKVGKTWYSATKVPIRDKDGKVIGLVGISRDITKIKNTEEELRRYSTRLEELVEERTKKLNEAQRLATIGETASMVGHDLRNPLQSIAAIPYLVGQTVQTMPDQVKGIVEKSSLPVLMDMLQDQTLYMNKIVSDLQDYARPVKLDLKETNLYDMISEILSTIQVAENIEVLIEIAHDFSATLDPYLLKRVFTNLISNSAQAMPEGGKLTIKAYRNDEEVALSVQDTGVGIPEENMPKIFQPLFTTKAKGQGLGLAVCKRIVEAHGGRITVTSKVRYGSTFTVHVPLRKEVKKDE